MTSHDKNALDTAPDSSKTGRAAAHPSVRRLRIRSLAACPPYTPWRGTIRSVPARPDRPTPDLPTGPRQTSVSLLRALVLARQAPVGQGDASPGPRGLVREEEEEER